MFFGSPVGNGFIEGGYASPVILHTGGFEKLASATATIKRVERVRVTFFVFAPYHTNL